MPVTVSSFAKKGKITGEELIPLQRCSECGIVSRVRPCSIHAPSTDSIVWATGSAFFHAVSMRNGSCTRLQPFAAMPVMRHTVLRATDVIRISRRTEAAVRERRADPN